MIRTVSVAHALFAATMIALGIAGVRSGDLGAIWQPVPETLPGREALAYLSSTIALAAGLGLSSSRTVSVASRVLWLWLLGWLLLFKAPAIALHPLTEAAYQSCGETAVILAGCWVLHGRFATEWDRRWLRFAIDPIGMRGGKVVFALALIAFGLSHFVYVGETAPLVPEWLPGHVFWAYFTGSTYLAAGMAVMLNCRARLAAALSTLQMALFTLLVWTPTIFEGPRSAASTAEWILSWTLTVSAWLVAESYGTGRAAG